MVKFLVLGLFSSSAILSGVLEYQQPDFKNSTVYTKCLQPNRVSSKQYALLLPQTDHQNSMLQHRVCYQRFRRITYWHSEWLLWWNGCMLCKTVIPRKQKWNGEFKLQIRIFSNWGHWNFQYLTGFDFYLLLMTNNVPTVSNFTDMGLYRSHS
jgi:hypothetical protein